MGREAPHLIEVAALPQNAETFGTSTSLRSHPGNLPSLTCNMEAFHHLSALCGWIALSQEQAATTIRSSPTFSSLVNGRCFHLGSAHVGQSDKVLQGHEAPQDQPLLGICHTLCHSDGYRSDQEGSSH